MSPKLAAKRYIRNLMGSSLGFLGAVFGVSRLHDKFTDGSAIAIMISALPSIFVGAMVWSVWRYLNEMDEVARHDHTQAMMSTLIIIITICGGWGLVELFNDNAPRLSIFYVFPAFFLLYGLISTFYYRRCAV